MNNKALKYIFGLMLLSVILVVGCGIGGSQSVLTQESPETAVMRISDSWRVSTTSPSVVVDGNNRFIRQASSQETDSENASDSGKKVIYLKDLSGNEPYKLEVVNVEKADNTAAVTCNFYYDKGTLIVVFKLVFEDEEWWLDDVEITDKAFEEGEAGYQTIHHLMIGEKELNAGYYSDFGKGKIGEIIKAQPKTFDGFKFVATYPNTIATGSILATTDSGYPLTLELYYRKLATYTFSIYLLGKDNSITSKTTIYDSVGFVGDKVSLTDKDLQKTYTGYKLITKDISESIKNITGLELQDDNSNELKLYYELDGKTEPETSNKISGTITDETGNIAATIQLFKIDEKGESVLVSSLDTENGEYSFEDLEDGDYLLVISAKGHEPKTIKMTLPESEKTNTRANIRL